MTFNIRYDEALFNKGKTKRTYWTNRKVLQVELIKNNQPDIIGIQEPHLHQIQYLDTQLDIYSWLGVGREDGAKKGEFNPIFYQNNKIGLERDQIECVSPFSGNFKGSKQ